MAISGPAGARPSRVNLRVDVGGQFLSVPITGPSGQVTGYAMIPQDPPSQAEANQLAAKLQGLCDRLAPGEQHILAAVLAQAAESAAPTLDATRGAAPDRAAVARTLLSRLTSQIQAFHDALPEGERQLLQSILGSPERPDVAGFANVTLSSQSYRPSARYVRVRMQQGRVQLDADFDG